MRRQYAFLTGIVLALLITGSVWAQDSTPEATEAQPQTLSYGTPVQGTIDDTNFQQDWPLGTASADRLSVRVKRTSGNLIPDVTILDATGTDIAHSYGPDNDYAGATIDDFTLPSAGTYTVEVTRDRGQDGATTGDYSLEVIPLGTGEENPNNKTIIGELQVDTPVDGEVTATHWQQLYTYNAPAADAIDVIVKRTGGTLTPIVNVLDANGDSLQTGYNQGATADTNEFELPAAGQYIIAVSRQNDQTGNTLGTYELTLHLVGSGEGSPLLEGAAGGTVTYDQELDGSITPGQWYQDWTLKTDAGDTITVNVTRKDGDLIPEVILLGGSGQEISHGYPDNTSATAEITRYGLNGPGTYTVRVTRQNDQTGETSGAYALTVTLNGTGEGSPKLTAPVGEVTLDTPVQGEVTSAQWDNVWTFNSDQGGKIDVTVERSDGTLSPTVEIRDANGQQMTMAYPSETRDSAQISNYGLPGPGTYQIVVSRENGQSGYTSGSYTLTVSASGQ